jgi:hypothetical protein
LPQNGLIPLFSSTGRCLGLRPQEAILRLEASNAVRCERKKGYLIAAFVIPTSEAPQRPPGRAYNCRGTRYTYRERLSERHTVLDLKRLTGLRTGINYAPDFLRPTFLRVVLDCLI